MPGQRKVLDKRGILLVVIAVAVIALILIFSPDAKAIHLQTKAGGIISDYVASLEQTEESEIGVFCCILPTLYPDAPIGTDLDQAISWLKEAKSIAPRNEYSSFLLGQAFCLARNYPEAMEELSTFYLRRSDNPLVVAELGFAHLAKEISRSDPQQNSKEYEIANLLLNQAGFGTRFFETTGEEAYKQGKYKDSLVWFNIAEKFGTLNEANNRKLAMLKVAFERATDIPSDLPMTTMAEETQELLIKPGMFFQLNNWQPVDVRRIGNNEAAVIWSNNNAIGTLINVSEPSESCLLISAIDQKPAPTQLAIYLDYQRVSEIELSEGDGQMKEFKVQITLEKGVSLVSIKLLNDYYSVSEGDRNGYIASTIISPCQSN